ncbi:MAG: hypothetical protein HQL14_04360 [Candidatus Omnitrophica bacterium]|nr:hypothetical protein [Candidatus Omnitrophota bacterium]
MNARTIYAAGLLCFLLTMPALAKTQTSKSAQAKPAADTGSIVSNIQSQLKLTEAQVQKITPIIEEENQKLSKILTPDQMNQWLNLLNQIHQKHKKSKHSNTAATNTAPSPAANTMTSAATSISTGEGTAAAVPPKT